MAKITIKPAKSVRGEVSPPGDKSISHRAVILGAIGKGDTEVHGLLESEDTLRTIEAFRGLGVEIEGPKGGHLLIRGRGLQGLKEPSDVIYAGNSGTTLRLLTGLLSGQRFFSVLTGDPSLRTRPMKRVVGPLRMMGAKIYGRKDGGSAPLAICGGDLRAINYRSPVASAQVKSAILLAALNVEDTTVVEEPVRSRDHTERMLRRFGADIRVDGRRVLLKGGTVLSGQGVDVPGDISSAAFFIVASLIVPDSSLLIRGLGINPTRIGIVSLLKRMGASMEFLDQRDESGEPVGDILIKSSPLHGIDIGSEDIPSAIDEFPILCVAASVASGETTIRGASELRVKESDRIAVMAGELKRLGVRVEEREDGMVIEGG
ncbi:MAG: 3-phosphoshikimate 1-carboxyvinyltransferase, partial [Thermodesulfobacteriota bacterium]